MQIQLYLGNRVYSSWSLRAWLLFRAFDIPFQCEVVPLYTEEFEEYRNQHYPARAVPSIVVNESANPIIIWDSYSITEYLNEQFPEAGIWPTEPSQRATARSLCAEMHSGFNALRSTMPMNLKRHYKNFKPISAAQQDIERIEGLWEWTKSSTGKTGPYLFGKKYTAADAFFTPVAERFRTYSVSLGEISTEYMNTLLQNPFAVEFNKAAQQEAWVMQHNEFDDCE